MALRHDLIGSTAPAGVAWKNFIGSIAPAGVAWKHFIGSTELAGVACKDFISTAHVTAIGVIVVTMHAMMIDVIVAVTVHSIMMMGGTLHVVVTAVVPGNTSTSSTCLCQGCSAGNHNCCPQASQKVPGFDH